MLRGILLIATSHVLAALLLLVAAGFWLDRPVWNAPKSTLLLVGLFAGAYVAGAITLALLNPRGRSRFVEAALVGAAAVGIAILGTQIAEWRWPDTFAGELPPGYGIFAYGFVIVALVVVTWVRDFQGSVLAWALPAALLLVLGIAHLAIQHESQETQPAEVSYIDSSRHVIKVTHYSRQFSERTRGGAIAALDDGYLVAGGAGGLYFVRQAGDPNWLDTVNLPYRVPINREEFADAGREAFGDGWSNHYHRERLRIADLVVQERPGGVLRVLVSHHFWKTAERCYVVRVSALEGSREALLGDEAIAEWRTAYESNPCIPFNSDGLRGAWFAGYQIGGAMALVDDDKLLVAVGDHEYDGWNRTPILPQDPGSPYGKTVLVDLASGAHEIYSLGHRNAQGMYIDDSGRIWSTEHGPRGGDELNLILRGANYGWPLATYGTEYWLRHWPISPTAATHAGFEAPIFAFVPSIALSALTGVSGQLFDDWSGDLMLVSLSGELARVSIAMGRAMVVERLTIGGRIRDIAEGQDGRLALWTDEHDVILLEPADERSAEAMVRMCAACHTYNRRETASIGPNLWQIVGRRVAADDDFEYSNAMRKFGGRWTRERLDDFLEDPAATVPGNSMQFDGIEDAEDRERLIEFLSQLR